MEMEAVRAMLSARLPREMTARSDMYTAILTDSVSLLQKWTWNEKTRPASDKDFCGSAVLDIKRNDQPERMVGKATMTSGLCLARSVVLKSLRHFWQAQRQGCHIINWGERSMQKKEVLAFYLERREIYAEKRTACILSWKGKKGPLSVRLTQELFQK